MKPLTVLILLLIGVGSSNGSDIPFFMGKLDGYFYAYPEGQSDVTVTSKELREGRPSLKIHLAKGSYSGAGIGRNQYIDLSDQVRTGIVRFYYKAAAGECPFKVSLLTVEQKRRRLIAKRESAIVANSEWQEAAIPLADFMGDKAFRFYQDPDSGEVVQSPFDLARVNEIRIENDPDSSCDIFVSDVRIEIP